MIFGRLNGSLCRVASVFVWQRQLVLYVLLVKELLELCGMFIVKAMELRFAPASCQGAMDVCYGGGYVPRCPAFDRLQQDAVAVIIIRDYEVIVAGAGRVWESPGLV